MVKIEALIRPFKLDQVRNALEELGIRRVGVSEVLEYGGPVLQKVFYRGAEYHAPTALIKVEILISSLLVDEATHALSAAASTGSASDDGAILVYEVAEAIQIGSGGRVYSTLG